MPVPAPFQATYAPEIVTVSADTEQVCCDGGQGPLGHPLVYYRFDGRARIECGYCDRIFVKAGTAEA